MGGWLGRGKGRVRGVARVGEGVRLYLTIAFLRPFMLGCLAFQAVAGCVGRSWQGELLDTSGSLR